MNKKEHLQYWVRNSKRDWKRAGLHFKNNDYVFSLYCVHLCLEKICKAIWVEKHKENHPPRIHNLVYLLEESDIAISDEHKDFLLVLNDFQLEGRYPDYKEKIYRYCKRKIASKYIAQSIIVKRWLHSILL